MNGKKKIKAEIESQLKIKDRGYSTGDAEHGYRDALEDILRFIDSLPEEPVNEDLEEAARDYINSDAVKAENMLLAFGDFIAGAEWMKEHLIEKTCEWLEKDAYHYYWWDINECFIDCDTEELIKDFRKAMEKEK